MNTGICEKHGRIMLHDEPCHDCRNKEHKECSYVFSHVNDSIEGKTFNVEVCTLCGGKLVTEL